MSPNIPNVSSRDHIVSDSSTQPTSSSMMLNLPNQHQDSVMTSPAHVRYRLSAPVTSSSDTPLTESGDYLVCGLWVFVLLAILIGGH